METIATTQVLLKNVPKAEVFTAQGLVEYQEGQVVSRTVCQTGAVTMTLFAFWQGEGISAHTVPGDALVQVLDGSAVVTVSGREYEVAAGESIVMPAGSPHGLTARTRFKMLLTLVKG